LLHSIHSRRSHLPLIVVQVGEKEEEIQSFGPDAKQGRGTVSALLSKDKPATRPKKAEIDGLLTARGKVREKAGPSRGGKLRDVMCVEKKRIFLPRKRPNRRKGGGLIFQERSVPMKSKDKGVSSRLKKKKP